MLNLSRFDKRILPFVSRFEPDRNNPIDREVSYTCDICDEAQAVLHAPEHLKIKWCRHCSVEVVMDFGLKEGDIEFI
jgi:hypothetical protein